MKTLRTLRKLKVRAPRSVRRRDFDISDIALGDGEQQASAPEAVFDRSTGPWDRRTASEET